MSIAAAVHPLDCWQFSVYELSSLGLVGIFAVYPGQIVWTGSALHCESYSIAAYPGQIMWTVHRASDKPLGALVDSCGNALRQFVSLLEDFHFLFFFGVFSLPQVSIS